MTDELVRERRGRVLVLRLNRPEARNALTPALMSELGEALAAAESDAEVGAVVLTGTGDRAFCAGLDLRTVAGDGAASLGDGDGARAFQRLLAGEIAVPLVGSANATAVGGGLELLLGCDVIVASSAAEFGLPEVRHGLFPGGNGTQLATRVPLGVALELTLTGDRIDAARALQLGLVNAVVEPAEVVDIGIAYAERMARNGPLAVRAAKELVRLAVTDPTRWAERRAHWQRVVFASDDAREGATAFVERREPRWQGR